MTQDDARSTENPTREPPDKDLTFDPEMTEGDEANVPPASDADPEAEGPGDGGD